MVKKIDSVTPSMTSFSEIFVTKGASGQVLRVAFVWFRELGVVWRRSRLFVGRDREVTRPMKARVRQRR